MAPPPTAIPKPTTIVNIAVGGGNFKTLLDSLTAAGLDKTLVGAGLFTVFAQTDEAFAKLSAGTLTALLADKAKLTAILTYYEVSGRVLAVVKLTTANTVNGKSVTIKMDGDKVYINDAQVIIADILTSNGVIHVIDKVILPPQ